MESYLLIINNFGFIDDISISENVTIPNLGWDIDKFRLIR